MLHDNTGHLHVLPAVCVSPFPSRTKPRASRRDINIALALFDSIITRFKTHNIVRDWFAT